MINNSKQNWTIGSTVKVGFMTLTVRAAVATPGDYAPDAYILQRADQLYSFVPHNGLTKIDEKQAMAMIEAGKLHAQRIAAAALAKAEKAAHLDRVFA